MGAVNKSANLPFDLLVLSILFSFNYQSTEKLSLMTLKSDPKFEEKLTLGIWWVLTRAVESLEICTLMVYFCQKYVIFKLRKYIWSVSWKMTNSSRNDIRNLVNIF